ncbi:MAG: exosortase T, partial [Gammaproteobacteria bacterium]|nr:exosortase T [Gammaproteobacteria bacterium]
MPKPSIQLILLGSAALILAAEPALWLVHTWLDPIYGGHGLPVFLMVVALFSWSLSTPRLRPDPRARRFALYLLVATAVIRLLGQVLAVNTLGALALVVDIYALALLSGLRWRRRPLSPFWLAVVFSFSLPLERILQRTIGFGLQQISADGACRTVGWLVDGVQCEGVHILAAGQEISVDLPCSGARGLLQLLLLLSVLATLVRPGWKDAFRGLFITLTAAVGANILRITALILGQIFPLGISVMASPWHDIIGLAALAIGAGPILLWATTGRTSPA